MTKPVPTWPRSECYAREMEDGAGRATPRLCMTEALHLTVVVVMQMTSVTSHTCPHVGTGPSPGLDAALWHGGLSTMGDEGASVGPAVQPLQQLVNLSSLQNKNPRPAMYCLPDTPKTEGHHVSGRGG